MKLTKEQLTEIRAIHEEDSAEGLGVAGCHRADLLVHIEALEADHDRVVAALRRDREAAEVHLEEAEAKAARLQSELNTARAAYSRHAVRVTEQQRDAARAEIALVTADRDSLLAMHGRTIKQIADGIRVAQLEARCERYEKAGKGNQK